MNNKERQIKVLEEEILNTVVGQALSISKDDAEGMAADLIYSGIVMVKVPLTNVERLEEMLNDSNLGMSEWNSKRAEYLDAGGVTAPNE